MQMFRRAVPYLGLVAMLFLDSCSMLGLRREVGKLESKGVIAVKVQPLPQTGAVTYAALIVENLEGQRETVGLQEVGASGLAAIHVVAGRGYTIAAFSDLNGNRRFDPGEPSGLLRDVTPTVLSSTRADEVAHELTLRKDNPDAPTMSVALPRENTELGGKVEFALGEIASLDEPRFAPEGGGTGLWQPFEFLRSNKVGLYFTEPYDPQRTPVVLVYGIGGSPQDWKWMIEHFPRERYQLWFFHYPSGMRLGRVADSLDRSLAQLQRQHGFTRCQIVAHSMGGLVARGAINRIAATRPQLSVPRFVSISTPWGGHSAAASGVRHLKKPVQSWLDVAPDSDYLKSLYQVPLPPATRHTLIYGHKTRKLPWLKGENDGTVEVASETDPRAAAAAARVIELPYEHIEILSQQRTLDLVLRALGS